MIFSIVKLQKKKHLQGVYSEFDIISSNIKSFDFYLNRPKLTKLTLSVKI